MKRVCIGTHPRSRSAIKPAVFLSLIMFLAAGFGGCGGIEAPESTRAPEAVATNNLKQLGLAVHNYDARVRFMDGSVRFLNDQDARPAESPAAPASQATDQSKSPDRPAELPRKIIYDARIDLLVKSLSDAERAILGLIKDNGGFLAEFDHRCSDRHPARCDLAGPRAG